MRKRAQRFVILTCQLLWWAYSEEPVTAPKSSPPLPDSKARVLSSILYSHQKLLEIILKKPRSAPEIWKYSFFTSEWVGEECPILQCKRMQPYQSQDKTYVAPKRRISFLRASESPPSLEEKAGLSLRQWYQWVPKSNGRAILSLGLDIHLLTPYLYLYVFIYTVSYFHLHWFVLPAKCHVFPYYQPYDLLRAKILLPCYCFLPFYIPHWCHVYLGVLFLTPKPTNFVGLLGWSAAGLSGNRVSLPACSELGGFAKVNGISTF